MNAHSVVPTVLGELTITSDRWAITGVYFEEHRYPPTADQLGERDDALPLHAEAARQLVAYVNGEITEFDLPLNPRGSEFYEKVWQRLLNIPRGETTTYGAIQREIGGNAIAQQVGQAVGHNPISIIVPCHRVVGHDGALTGYAGGLARKKFLLELEESAEVSGSRLF